MASEIIHWIGTEDQQQAERMKACKERRKQWGEDHCDDKDGSCTECEYDMADALRVKEPAGRSILDGGREP